MRMQILVGLPGSGKSTYAAEKVKEGWVRVNYDSIRHESSQFPNGYVFSQENEKRVKVIAENLAAASLRSGLNVVIDNTNLTNSSQKPWYNLSYLYRVSPEIINFDTPLDECLARNEKREGWARVPRAVVERMALWNNRVEWPVDQKVVIVDMDGTLANSSVRTPYVSGKCPCVTFAPYALCVNCGGTGKVKKDWKRFFNEVGNDKPNKVVAEWVKSLQGTYYVCVVSGRPLDQCGPQTEEWLYRNQIPFDRLFMRAAGDKRDDTIIKKEILDKIQSHTEVAYAIDDRPSVIRMWRENGVKCYDVGNGVEF